MTLFATITDDFRDSVTDFESINFRQCCCETLAVQVIPFGLIMHQVSSFGRVVQK